jgi:5,10-methenyltetrahydromethanopterin hydrogenase
MKKKDPNVYPPGYDHKRIAAIAKFYDEQNDDEMVEEIEAAASDSDTVMVQVPRKLLPEVLKLIEKRKKTA